MNVFFSGKWRKLGEKILRPWESSAGHYFFATYALLFIDHSLATDLMAAPQAGEAAAAGGNTFTKSELKRVFELHTNTNCYTHDLLDCQCLENKSTEEPDRWEEENQVEGSMARLDEAESDGSLPDLEIRN